MLSRRTLLGVCLANTVVPSALASDWPVKPVKLIVPFAPGGSVDITARLLGSVLGEKLGQQIVVENRSGSGGTIGATAVAKAPADGYTLLWANSAVMTVAPSLVADLPYDPVKELRPVSLAMRTWHVVLGSPVQPYRNLTELLTAARAKPGDLTFGSGGTGSAVHIVAARIMAESKTSMVHVPYRGSGQALLDLTSGRINMLVETLASGMQAVRSGRATALAISSPSRIASAPDVPTVAESGFADFVTSAWFGIVAPAGMPDAVVAKLNGAIRAALETPDLRNRLKDIDVDVIGSTADEFAKFMVGEAEITARLIKSTGIKLE
jgi:tripartite-type tricarboxylate transporter receptor subunit TctC